MKYWNSYDGRVVVKRPYPERRWYPPTISLLTEQDEILLCRALRRVIASEETGWCGVQKEPTELSVFCAQTLKRLEEYKP